MEIDKEQFDKEQQEIEIEIARCQFCGKHLKIPQFDTHYVLHPFCNDFCNDKCEINMEKLWAERQTKGVCMSCGNPKIPENQKNYPKKKCMACLIKITKLLERCDFLKREIDGT
jgi:hypothetical protein